MVSEDGRLKIEEREREKKKEGVVNAKLVAEIYACVCEHVEMSQVFREITRG